jgi:hypothetical protein
LAHHNPVEALALSTGWSGSSSGHGDGDEALTRAQGLAADVAALNSGYSGLKRLVKAAAGLATYLANNCHDDFRRKKRPPPAFWQSPNLGASSCPASERNRAFTLGPWQLVCRP